MQYALTLYHLLHNGVENKLAEQNKGKAPLGEAVRGLWSYLTCLQRDWLWCSENPPQTVTHSPENNCQTCSWAHWLPCRQHRYELLFIRCLKCLLIVLWTHCLASWVLLHDLWQCWFCFFCLWTVRYLWMTELSVLCLQEMCDSC